MAADLVYSLFRGTITDAAAKPDSNCVPLDSDGVEGVGSITRLDKLHAASAVNAWGHICKTKSTLDKVLRASTFQSRNTDDLNRLCLDEIYRLRKLLLAESKKNALLKDLLVNELNRSEEVDRQMSNTNDVINTMSSTIALVKRKNQTLEEEHRKVKSKLQRLEEGVGSSGQSVDGSVATAEDDHEPEPSYIGRYIYKSFPPDGHFVGYVVSFKRPYYRVVYEDGDMEDMIRKEVLHHWVSDSNLSAQKKILCQRTAKKLMVAPAIPPKQAVQLK